MSATIATSDGPSRLESWLREAWLPIAFVIALFGIWEACVHVFDIQPYMLPAPSAFFYQLGFRFERIWDYTLVTGSETLAGFLLAVVIGVPLSLVIAFSWVLRRTLYPLAVTLEMIPKIAFAPIMVSWLGFAFSGKVVIVFMVCFFPILLNGILAFGPTVVATAAKEVVVPLSNPSTIEVHENEADETVPSSTVALQRKPLVWWSSVAGASQYRVYIGGELVAVVQHEPSRLHHQVVLAQDVRRDGGAWTDLRVEAVSAAGAETVGTARPLFVPGVLPLY